MLDIHTWWPKLSIEAKHELVEARGTSLSDTVRDEIAAITGEEVPSSETLSRDDVEFIETQREQVD